MDKSRVKITSFRQILQFAKPVKMAVVSTKQTHSIKAPTKNIQRIIQPRTPQPPPVDQARVRNIQTPPIISPPIVQAPPQPRYVRHQISPAKQVQPRPVIRAFKRTGPLKGGNNTSPRSMINDPMKDKIRQYLFNQGVGRILIMIAAGPSVKEVDFTPILTHDKIDIMCINKPYQPVWERTRYWSFCDHTQYNRNQDAWSTFQGVIINSKNVTARRQNQVVIESRAGRGFSIDMTIGYFVGRSTTYATMQAAQYMNYDKIYIFGCDMAEVNGQLHHYGVNPDVAPENRKQRFKLESDNYSWAAEHVPEQIRKKYYFCSSYNPWDFVNKFNKMDHITAPSEIIKQIYQ